MKLLLLVVLVLAVMTAALKAEVVEPKTVAAPVAPVAPKCENGSCWVYSGTNIHVDFSRGISSGAVITALRGEASAEQTVYCAQCRGSFGAIPSLPTNSYYSKPCLAARR